jgi:hypothetical protein
LITSATSSGARLLALAGVVAYTAVTAVLDHFQALVSAVTAKLASGAARSRADDTVGGSTWSIDLWAGHPLEREALGTLARVRAEIDDLRRRVDSESARTAAGGPRKRVIYYIGQYVREEDSLDDGVSG